MKRLRPAAHNTATLKPALLTQQQSKYQCVFKGLMAPTGEALHHCAAPLLLELATVGCRADVGESWTIDMLEAAIKKGAHPSALLPEAAAQLRSETLEKVEQGYARLVSWNDIKSNPPKTLKISPIAAIPHKSRQYRMILDLSHGVHLDHTRHLSVNEATNPTIAPKESMAELGRVLPRLIYAVATAPDAKGPVLFSKLDIKDGYWRMVVPADDEWNFAYVLPQTNTMEPTTLVIPSALQMGWCDSPAYFCAASETARDVGESLTARPLGSLAEHPLENMLLRPEDWPENTMDTTSQSFTRLLEVYIDDFIQLAQTTDPKHLSHLSRAILHGIHSIFPPPTVTGHEGGDPISLKKLEHGDGLWAVRKELLGWVFDGVRRCIELPPEKISRITTEIHQLTRRPTVSRKSFEQLRGRLRHACIGIPAGKGLMGPIDAALRGGNRAIKIRENPLLRTALQDFGTLIKVLGRRPTHCRELVVDEPGFLGYCDASTLGAGGIWLSGTRLLGAPTVWRVEWPDDIRASVVSFANPQGTISNSDLEMAGMLIHFLVLEHLVTLKHIHIAAWCDNTPTVSWTNKLSSSRSQIAGRLTRALALRIHANEASPLISVSIAGQLVARLPLERQAEFADLLRAAGEAVDAGVVAANHAERLRYWKVWLEYVEPFTGVDAMLTNVPIPLRIELLIGFASRVRHGDYGAGTKVGAGTIQEVALRAIGKTFELEGVPNPTYRSEGKYWLKLQRQIEAYRRYDPPPRHKLAIPVTVINHLITIGGKSHSHKLQASCDMAAIAFYYLLRVGEYTGHRRKERRRTKQFRACDIIFYNAKDEIIPNTAPLHDLYNATTAVMRITNQKNGTRGSRISHTTSGTIACPVRALARRVHYIMQHPECNDKDIISTYYSTRTKSARPLQANDINKLIKSAVSLLGLTKKGFPPESVSSHSLRAGGAMAMHLNNIDRDKIRKQGRWSSDTFLMYIHEQISAFSVGMALKMSTEIAWHNIDGPTLTTPTDTAK